MKFGTMLLTAVLAVSVVSCKKEGCTEATATNYDSKAKKDDGSCVFPETPTTPATPNTVVSGAISVNTTWTADVIYELAGKVVVESGATLTIQPGTIIKGREGSGTLASALVIARGGKINANGTSAAPIIFTSVLDNIKVGEIVGTNLTELDFGLWGGVIVLGNAPISAANGDNVAQVEGIPTSDTFGAFGGADANDNSGVLNFISIRHGGALIGEGNEINGLTLGGVGSGTTVTNIEVIANLDDGIEFFGGTVNVSNVLIGFQGDDGLDIDMNYSGTITNFLVINNGNSDKGLEIDGPEGSTYVNGLFSLVNGICKVEGSASYATCDFKDKAQGTLTNVKIGTAKIRASYQNECADPKTDAFTHLTAAVPTLSFIGTEFSGATVYTGSTNSSSSACPVQTADQPAADAAMTSAVATGGTANYSWTWAQAKGKL